MSSAKRPWLADVPWDLVTFQNASFCEAKNALHKPTSDGHDQTKQLWESLHQHPMTLFEVIDLCHRMAPFCFYNGNTFAAIARSLLDDLGLQPAKAATVRSLAGHIVAGVASEEEITAFKAFSDGLE